MIEAADALKDAMERESSVRELHKAYPEWGGDKEGEPTAFCIVCCASGCSYPGHTHVGHGKPSCPTIAILDGGEG